MYRVGFGDFFLLSVPATGGFAHVLIDCGVHAHDIKAMPEALAQLKADTGGRLDLIIMTHRHADHISGFASGKDLFATFVVERVWMSWFEDPHDAVAFRIQAGLTAVARHLGAALAARAAPGDLQYSHMAGNILGEAGAAGAASGNDVALGVLHAFKTPDGKPTPVDYYRAGDAAILPPSLADAGLTAQILGPPGDLALVAKMDNKAHQYLTSAGTDGDAAVPPFATAFVQPDYAWPAAATMLYSLEEIERHVAANQADLLAAAAQNADNAMNNQSLVVLFRFAGKTMLFCGDAQWGNWANFLFGGALGTAGHTQLTDASRSILGALDFYKVGHHGSTNATPIDVVNAMKLGCVAMCSTDPGAYGKACKGTEVPRVPLLDALAERTQRQLARSDQVPAGVDTEVDQALGPLAPVFQAGADGKFIDYHL
jgi:beta-lactamase superfamily II metal-dependent hydrolase